MALTGLRGICGEMRIELKGSASTGEETGLDRTRFQNAVHQHLEEAGIEFEERWE